MFKPDLEKAEEPEIKLPSSAGSQKNTREFQRKICFMTMLWTLCDHNKLWKILKELGIPDDLTCLLRNLCASQEATVRTKPWNNRLAQNWGKSVPRMYIVTQQTGSKLGKECTKDVYCHPVHLTYMQSTSWEMPGWMNHKLESRLSGEILITSYMQMTLPFWQKVKRN